MVKSFDNVQILVDADDSVCIYLYHHGPGAGYFVYFNPFSGEFLDHSFLSHKRQNKEAAKIWKDKKYYLDFLKCVYYEKKVKHKLGICKTLSYCIDGGDDDGMTSLIHIPNIRTYAVLNKKEYGGWTAMNYCPFCGAKFPERLDRKLTEILQNEYGLTSWKEYKKAPHEFYTDEWWKKRGL